MVLMATLAAGVLADSMFELEPLVELFRLGSSAWREGQVWRVVTYGLVGSGPLSMWSVLQLVLVYWCVMEAVVLLGERATRVLILGGIVAAGASALLAQAFSDAIGGPTRAYPFRMMQGQSVVVALALPAFAARNRHSTVMRTPLLFGLPIPSRWLVPLQILAALAAFTSTRDFGGFVGIMTAIGWSMWFARPRSRW